MSARLRDVEALRAFVREAYERYIDPIEGYENSLYDTLKMSIDDLGEVVETMAACERDGDPFPPPGNEQRMAGFVAGAVAEVAEFLAYVVRSREHFEARAHRLLGMSVWDDFTARSLGEGNIFTTLDALHAAGVAYQGRTAERIETSRAAMLP